MAGERRRGHIGSVNYKTEGVGGIANEGST